MLYSLRRAMNALAQELKELSAESHALEDMMGAANSAPLLLDLLLKLEHDSHGTDGEHSFPWQSLKASQCVIELAVNREK